MIKVPQLTDEEIQTLQVDALLRLLGIISQRMSELNAEFISANWNYYEAKKILDEKKIEKNTLVETARMLKAMLCNA